ncbi:hypothetical protein BBJ28_00017762 [Nothophytophthora sp. Chile5]|nr:hypothetical protein BBJ28_00017762 [Nothophytophthora sp. Chile5]
MAPRAHSPTFSSPRAAATATGRSRSKKNGVNNSPIKTHMVVINWENVLVPLDWMIVHLGLRKTTASIEQAIVRCQQSSGLAVKLAAIEERILSLLIEVLRSANGPVFIVSECPTVYVELVSSIFFPRFTAALRNASSGIYVVGVPDTQLTGFELANWKVNLLQTVVCERLFAHRSTADAWNLLKSPMSGRIGVLALCAAKADVEAATKIQTVAPFAVMKRIKIRGTRPNLVAPRSLEAFHEQLQMLTQLVAQAVSNTQPINVELVDPTTHL